MAKTPNPKHHKASLHSRASRRASSPALEGNLDKSLRSVPRPSSPKPNIVLAPRNGAGVTKGNRKGGKVLKRKQRVRVEMGRERAENAGGKMERKVRRAEMRGEGRRGRNADWDELNERITGKKKRKKAKGVGGKGELDEWEDEDVEVTDAGGKAVDQVPSDVGKAGMEAEATTGDVGVDVADEIT